MDQTQSSSSFSIQSLDNNLETVTYDHLKDNNLLAKYSCYTSYEQMPSFTDFESLVKNIQ